MKKLLLVLVAVGGLLLASCASLSSNSQLSPDREPARPPRLPSDSAAAPTGSSPNR